MTYCDYCKERAPEDVHRKYHDQQYGFPLEEDNELFGRLILEINQAGLSWETILKKEVNFRKAYSGYDIEQVAGYGDNDIQRLLNDAGIIRNKLKVNAVIHNARELMRMRGEGTGFSTWLDANHPRNKEEWTKLFRKTFKFVGGEIVNEFLMSTGYLPGAHQESCPVFDKIKQQKPKWMEL